MHKYGKKEYKPFYVTWNNDITKLFDTKGQLARKLNVLRFHISMNNIFTMKKRKTC